MTAVFEAVCPLPQGAHALRGIHWLTTDPDRHPIARTIYSDDNPLDGSHVLHALQVNLGAELVPTRRRMAAFVLFGHAPRVLERVAECLVAALHLAGNPAKMIDARCAGDDVSNAAAAVLVDWDCGAHAANVIRTALAHDPLIDRIVVLGATRELRRRHDTRMVDAFVAGGSRLLSQLLPGTPHVWRFSEFTVIEEASIAGARFTIRFPFGDLGRHERSLAAAAADIRRAKGPRVDVSAGTHRTPSRTNDCSDTDLLFREPVLQLRTRWCTGRARRLVARLLATLAHLAADIESARATKAHPTPGPSGAAHASQAAGQAMATRILATTND